MSFVYVIVGFVMLIIGADKFVSGASSLAKKLGVPSLIIGLTIVSFGTSSPEFAVSITAALNGSSDISVGNAVGSSIFNLLMVLGASAIVAPILIEKELINRDLTASIISIITVMAFVLIDGNISRLDALLLLALYGVVFYLQVKSALKNKNDEVDDEVEMTNNPMKILVYIVFGLAFIIGGGQIAVFGATEIAVLFGLSEALIGLTVVAVGTSLPEFITSVIATKKGETDIAIGNVVGANIFNIFVNLGVTSLICPITTDPSAIYDLIFLLFVAITTFAIGKTGQMNRKFGIMYVLMYVGYTIYLIAR
ncbi:MAG: calcium/sodium antiporter [Clostridia bacterium]